MKIARFDDGHGAKIGLITSDRIVGIGSDDDIIKLMDRFDQSRDAMQAALQSSDGIPLSSVRLLAPVPRPGKIFAIGLNYADHVAESKMETPTHQVWFTKAMTSINGPFDPVQIPRVSAYVDYEVELVAVIGKRCKHVSREEAADKIFGYCIGNDVTERFWQHRTPQWSLGKSFDTHAPIGPWLTTSDEIPDPHQLDISCTVNGDLRQTSNTKHLIFNIYDQIAHLSAAMTLEPGDLIFTGTPGGIGAAMDPRVFLKAGDVVTCAISRLGQITNNFVAEE